MRALVVDDDDMMRRMVPAVVATALGVPTEEVAAAASPQEARALLSQAGPELALVLSDFNLRASATGLQLLREVAQTHPHATRVLMSGYDAGQIGLGGDEPIDAFLEKPMRLQDIVEPLQEAVRKRGRRTPR